MFFIVIFFNKKSVLFNIGFDGHPPIRNLSQCHVYCKNIMKESCGSNGKLLPYNIGSIIHRS